MTNETMTIGELADRSGVPVKTIRRYSDRGLVLGLGRSEGNYRLYDDSALECLQAIVTLRGLGLSLGDIERLSAFYGEAPRHTIGPWLLERLAAIRDEVDRQVERLEYMRANIDAFVDEHADDLRRSDLDDVARDVTTPGDDPRRPPARGGIAPVPTGVIPPPRRAPERSEA